MTDGDIAVGDAVDAAEVVGVILIEDVVQAEFGFRGYFTEMKTNRPGRVQVDRVQIFSEFPCRESARRQFTAEIGYPRTGKEFLMIRFLFASGLNDLAEFAGVLAIESAGMGVVVASR